MTDGSNRNPDSPSPFLVKTYEMVDEPSTDSVVSWSVAGISFVVWNPPEFSRDMLPKYFKHNNFSSFIRQLNTYGFRKVDPHQWEFANEEFVRGHKHLLKKIHRRKPGQSHTNAAPVSNEERREFLNANERLRRENLSLQSEIERHKHENHEYESQVRSLVQTLRSIEQRQKRLKISLGWLMEKPGRVNKKRRVLGMQRLRDEDEEENLGVSNSLPNLLNVDLVERLDSSTAFWEGFVEEIPGSNEDDWCCSPGVDVSTLSMEQQERDGGVVSSAGANDDFWQQFFTEDPGSSVQRSGEDHDRVGH